MKNIQNDIKTKNFKPLYLICGEETKLRYDAVNKLKTAVTAEGGEEDSFEGDFDPYDLINAANTLSLFGGLRFISVKDSNAFSGSKYEKLTDYFKDPNPSCIVVFNERKIDKRSKVYKAFVKAGYVYECKKPTPKEIRALILNLARENNLSFEKNALEIFLSNLEDDFSSAENEFEKLIAYTLGKPSVTAEDVEAVTTKKTESRIFDLIDAAAGKKPQKALEILSSLILQKESNVAILIALSRQFRLILKYKYLSKTMPKDEITKKMGVHPYVVSKTAAQAKSFSNRQLLSALADCKNLLKDSFSGNIDLTRGIEIIILKYAA